MNSKLKNPIAVKWTISEDRLYKKKDKIGEFLSTECFNASNIPGLQYRFSLYPYGNKEEIRGQTWIFLNFKYSGYGKIEIETDIKISIPTANYFLTVTNVSKCEEWGKYLFAMEELIDPKNGFIADGKLTFKMEGTLMTKKYMPEKFEFYRSHSDTLCVALWAQEESKDFMFVVNEKKINAHKIVLSARSPVFAAMFQSGMKETKENKVEITDFEFEIVEKSIKLCYHPSLVNTISFEDKMKMLQFFDKYDIQALKDDLESYMITVIDSSTVCLLINCSLLSNSSKLKEKCSEFLCNCLQKSQPIADFDLLDKDFALNLMKNAFFQVSK